MVKDDYAVLGSAAVGFGAFPGGEFGVYFRVWAGSEGGCEGEKEGEEGEERHFNECGVVAKKNVDEEARRGGTVMFKYIYIYIPYADKTIFKCNSQPKLTHQPPNPRRSSSFP